MPSPTKRVNPSSVELVSSGLGGVGPSQRQRAIPAPLLQLVLRSNLSLSLDDNLESVERLPNLFVSLTLNDPSETFADRSRSVLRHEHPPGIQPVAERQLIGMLPTEEKMPSQVRTERLDESDQRPRRRVGRPDSFAIAASYARE